MKPTEEQQAVVDAFLAGKSIVVTAVAGAGKTSTLRLLAEAAPDKTFCYVAYNRAIAHEAQGKMPANVTSKTAHAFAASAMRAYMPRVKLGEGYFPLKDTVAFLGLPRTDLVLGDRRLSPYNLARIVTDMVAKFCRSADPVLTTKHMVQVEGLEPKHYPVLAKRLLPYAQKAWADLSQTSGRLKFGHDHYLKLWQLSGPVLAYDVILFDEAQDANPVIDAIVSAQHHAQRIMVGDQAQAIYGWNGAIDAMAKFDCDVRLTLTQSFRFGPAIADEANRWLDELGSEIKVRGTEDIESVVEPLAEPKAVLCRTNAGCITTAMDLQARGLKVHFVKGSSDIEKFAKGALELQTKRWTSHPVLSVFSTWGEVKQYAEDDPNGADIALLVRLIDTHGAQAILDVLRNAVSEDKADVVVSTAHKSKGREWSSVRIGSDFERKPAKGQTEPPPLTPEEIMLRYVAVTRAMRVLDPGPLRSLTGGKQ